MIDSKNVRVNLALNSWQEAVRSAGELLTSAGFVEPRYIDSMLQTIEALGPYSVIAPGIVMPHARPEDGVLLPGFSAVTLDPPIYFGSPDNDPVHLVIAFSATNHDDHIETLAALAKTISSESFIERVINSKGAGQLANVLNGVSGQ